MTRDVPLFCCSCLLLINLVTLSCRSPEPAVMRPSAPASGANVLLVSIDTLRADRLPAYGYKALETPTLSRLAADGVRFDAAYTPVPLTLPAHASLFTGLLPISHGVRDNGGFTLGTTHATLAETLKSKGYATGAFVSAFVLDSRWGLARGFDHYFDSFTVASGDLRAMASIQRTAETTWAEARTWLDQNAANRFFTWVHFFDPHTPYAPPAAFTAQFAERPYDGEIAYVDSVLAQMVRYLESNALLDQTLIFIVSDHGEGLGEHAEDEHGLLAYDSTLRVPWIVRLPNRQLSGRVIAEPVGLVDVFPTIVGLLGISAAPKIDGVDRTPLIIAGQGSTDALYAETFYPRLRMGWSELLTIRSGEYKYIKAPVPELYNYRTDPREMTNLAAREPEVVTRLDRILTRVLGERSTAAPRASTPDPQTVRQLQALGYVSGAPAVIDTSKGLIDPKTKTAVYRDLTRARQQLAEGPEPQGLRTLQAIVLAEPSLESARRTLREYWISRRRFEEATKWFRMAALRHSSEAGLWRDLASVARASGDRATAVEAIGRAGAIHPDDAETLVISGEIQREAGQLAAALASFKRASEVAPDPTVARMQAAQTLIAMRNFPDADLLVRSVLAADPNASNGHYLLAQIAEARQDLRTAEYHYRQEIERNPWEYRARFNLALLIGARGDRQEHLALLQSIPPIAPAFGEVHFYIAKALLDLGDRRRFPEAVEAAERGLRLAPNASSAPLGHYVLGDIYNLTNRPADASRAIQRGRELERRLARPGH